MDSLVGLLVAVCVFAGAMAGLSLHRLLPPHHLSKESREAVRLGTGMLSILSALVLGLLIASSKGTFDRASQHVREYAADIIQLDRVLRAYGPEADPVRAELLRYTEQTLHTWNTPGESDSRSPEDEQMGHQLDGIARKIAALKAETPGQVKLKEKIQSAADQLIRLRWSLLTNAYGTPHLALLAIVTAWIALIFASFGMNSPVNPTVITSYFVCAVSIGLSFFLILDMETPFTGLLTVSSDPIKNAVLHLQRMF